MVKLTLDITNPEIAAEWHPTKNGDLKPSEFSYGSGKVVWWKCPKGGDHEWEATIYNRTMQGAKCSKCYN